MRAWHHSAMIPVLFCRGWPALGRTAVRWSGVLALTAAHAVAHAAAPASTPGAAPTPGTASPTAAAPPAAAAAKAPTVAPAPTCLPSGDGYLRARVRGAIETRIDWPNSGTRCNGETKAKPPGVRLSFQRPGGTTGNLLFVFGLTGVQPGKPGRAVATNLTVIVQGSERIFGTLGDSRCTVDSLAQRPLTAPGAYRLEAHGFCTQPARAIHGPGEVLVSTFDFAGLVNYDAETPASPAPATAAARP